MSETAGRPAGQPDDGFTKHADWELPEALAAVILVAFAVLTATAVAVGLTAGLGHEGPGITARQVVGLALQQATGWANPAFAFVLVSATWLVWWQVRIWSAEIALADAAFGDIDEGDVDSPLLIAAFDHLLRAKSLASWALPLLVAAMAGAAASVVATFLLYGGEGAGAGAGGLVWANHLETVGFAAATWVLAGAGVVAAVYVRTQVSHEFTLAEDAASEAERRAEAMSRGASGPGAGDAVGAAPVDEGPGAGAPRDEADGTDAPGGAGGAGGEGS